MITRRRSQGANIPAWGVFSVRWLWLGLAAPLMLALNAQAISGAAEPRSGGLLNATLEEAPPSFSIHEEATAAAVWPVMPCYNNLVLFDPLKPQESLNTIVGELAEQWAWQDGGKALVFHLRKGVAWHDGQPFSSKDVKYTFDVVREAPGAPGKLRVNPRKLWYENVASLETPDPDTVVFHLKRPQPSLLLMLASGYSPVYPAHVPPAELRTKCLGTGPFKLKEYRPGEYIDLVKNPDYMIKGRPYLDGIRYLIIKERGTRYAAIQAGRQDIAYPLESSKTIAEEVKQANPRIVLVETSSNVNDNILLNFRRPIFQDPRIRRAISLAVDRKAYIQAGRQGAAISGGIMLPKPYGVWGLPEAAQAKLPGFGDPAANRLEAKKLLAEAGYGPEKPLKLAVSTREVARYVDIASFVIDQLKRVAIEATLEQ
ncbi:MAG TPA: ABC transporter substrate-binding protein, partial [archaeon]|nr:ABC transporter substrate-binding protein [archaeon]